MAVTKNESLVKEFKKYTKQNYRGYCTKPPLPNMPKIEGFKGVYVVQGVENEYYSKLNGTVVTGLKTGQEPSRRVIKRTGEVEKYGDQIKREPVSVPRHMHAVTTPLPLGLPWGYNEDEEEFQYVDFFETENNGVCERTYMYLIDNKYLYEFNQIALVYSNKRLNRTYKTIKVKTWNHGVVFLSLIPFENNTYRKAQILSIGTLESFKGIIPKIMKKWVDTAFICPPQVFKDSEEGEAIVFQEEEGNLEVPSEGLKTVSLAEERGKGLASEDSLVDEYELNDF